MSWAQPMWWLALIAVVAVGVLALLGAAVHRRRLAEVFSGEILGRVVPTSVRVRRTLRDVLAVTGLALIVVALVEPRYGKEVQQVRAKGVDIAIAVDLSRSMDAQDVHPSRLERARREILDLVDLLEADRVGLVIFAGGAFPRLPLTTDTDALELVVRELSTDMFQAQGSELGEAIRTALRLLDGSDRPAGKAILILSDGEVHDPADALAAAREAKEAGVRIYAMGIGDEPAPIPLPGGGVLTDGGTTVISDPDPTVLREVARVTGGAYVDSVASAEDVQTLYESEIRGTLSAALSSAMQRETWRTGFQWPLSLAVVCWLLSAWLGEGRRRWGMAAALLAFAVLPAHAADPTEGDALYRQGAYREAVEVFTELAMEDPGNRELWERLGAARYRAGDFDGAARAFDTAVELGAGIDAQYNAGNAHYLAGRLEEALARYDAVLAQDPQHEGARGNRDLLVNELDARRRLQPPPPPPPQAGDPGEQGDGDPQQDPQQGEGTGEDQPQQGEQQGGDPQHGEQGEPQGGASDPGEPATAQRGEGGDGDQPPDGQADAQGERTPGEGDQELDRDGEHGIADLAEGDPAGGEADETAQAGGDGGIDGEEGGPVTRGQAERMLDGVQEGRPRVRIPGRGTSKPW